MKTNRTPRSAFTFVEIMIVVAIIGLLAAIAIPNFVQAHRASQRNICIANLKQIDGAKRTWTMENKKSNSDSPTANDLYGTKNYIRDEPLCPAGGTYTIGAVGELPSCSLAHTYGHTNSPSR